MIRDSFGKLFNEGGEIVAEGSCQVDEDNGRVTMRPLIDTPLMSQQQGTLRLALDDGDDIYVSGRVIRFRLNLPGVPPGAAYRLFIESASGQKVSGE